MKITIKPKEFKGLDDWYSKLDSVILVEKEENIETLFKLLCEQDNYWSHYKHLIKVAPKEIESENDIEKMCQYCGKTDIDNIKELKQKIDFIIYQKRNQYEMD